MEDYEGPERRRLNGPTWRDLTDALDGLRQEVRHDLSEVRMAGIENTKELRREIGELREDLEEGFERTDRRIIAAAVAITSLLAIAITIATSLMR